MPIQFRYMNSALVDRVHVGFDYGCELSDIPRNKTLPDLRILGMIEGEQKNEFKLVIIEKLLRWQGALTHLQRDEEIQDASTVTRENEQLRSIPVRSRIAIRICTRHETQCIVVFLRVERKTTAVVAVGALR